VNNDPPDFTMIGTTVQQEHEARGCRAGLQGVHVTVLEHPGEFIIAGSRWTRDRQLVLNVYPADGPRPVLFRCVNPKEHQSWHTAECYSSPTWPPGTLHGVPESACTLSSEWPVVCCKPRRRRRKIRPH
jgi:hypothetical protein